MLHRSGNRSHAPLVPAAVSARIGTPVAIALAAATLLTSAMLCAPVWSAESETPITPAPPPVGMEGWRSEAPKGPALREDEPATGGGRTPEAGDADPPPQGGCPYRGRTLELIV